MTERHPNAEPATTIRRENRAMETTEGRPTAYCRAAPHARWVCKLNELFQPLRSFDI